MFRNIVYFSYYIVHWLPLLLYLNKLLKTLVPFFLKFDEYKKLTTVRLCILSIWTAIIIKNNTSLFDSNFIKPRYRKQVLRQVCFFIMFFIFDKYKLFYDLLFTFRNSCFRFKFNKQSFLNKCYTMLIQVSLLNKKIIIVSL